MAEKKVSVRLVAEGGRRVRAELEGVGEAGAKGFGRLSREMDLANTRLAAFARRAGLALGAAGAAATASLGLIVRSTAESAAQIRQFAQVANATPEALQRWSAGARTVGIEQEKLADILKDVNDRVGDFLQTGGGPMADFFENVAPRVGVTADQFARLSGPEALQLYVDTLERAGLSQQEMTFYLEAMASDATRLIPLLRNGGAEMARLGDQAASFGTVLDGKALEALRRTQLALGTVSLVFDGLRNRIAVAVAPTIEALANAFVALASDGGILRIAIDTLTGNLGRLASYAATFATLMAGRWVAGLAAAALSVRGLATALVFLRGALIRTGIGALIVGAGELVYQFGRLVSGTGGFGQALELLGGVARAVWDGIKASTGSLVDDFRALKADIEGIWTRLMAFLASKWAGFLGMIGPTFNAVSERIGAGVQIDWFGAEAQASMLEHAASNAGAMADRYRQRASNTRAGAFDAVRPAMAALIEAMNGTGSETDDALDAAAAGAGRVTAALNATETAAGGAGTAGRAAGTETAKGAKAALTGWQAVTAALSDYATKAREIGEDIGTALVGAFQGAENAVGEFVKTGKLNMRDLVTSMIADLAKLAARRFILGPIANALSGALGSAGGIFANILHTGGMVGAPGPGRMVPTMAFANAPRMHAGGWAGLRPDEVPAILQRGERVLSRREAAGYSAAAPIAAAPVSITIMTRDAESFRQSRTQVASDIARAVSLGRRGL